MSSVLPAPSLARPAGSAWLLWLGLLAALLLLFRDTAESMVAIWIRSETFTHAFLVPVISVWLVWQRRAVLRRLHVRPVPWLLLPVAGVCLGWLAGELAGVQSASQFALISLLVLSVPAVLGWQVARAMAFPLLFLYFAVPWGEFMLPWLIERTADFTVMALRLSGIPVYREAQQFVIPSGNWSVVEACSGLRYIVASFMVGTLFAYLNYNSLKRRLGFVLVSLLVPLVANWVRAYLIVMIGHLSGNKLATGVDHLVYGWVFFGIVMVVMFTIGARWSEPRPDGPKEASDASVASGVASWAPRRSAVAALAVLSLCLAAHAALWRLDHAGGNEIVVLAGLPPQLGAWRAQVAEPGAFEPAFKNANAKLVVQFDRAGQKIGMWVGYYRLQNAQRKLVSTSNLLVESKGSGWLQTASGLQSLALPTATTHWRTARLRNVDPMAASDGATQAGVAGVLDRRALDRRRRSGQAVGRLGPFARPRRRRRGADAFSTHAEVRRPRAGAGRAGHAPCCLRWRHALRAGAFGRALTSTSPWILRPLVAHVLYRFDTGRPGERRRQPDQPHARGRVPPHGDRA